MPIIDTIISYAILSNKPGLKNVLVKKSDF